MLTNGTAAVAEPAAPLRIAPVEVVLPTPAVRRARGGGGATLRMPGAGARARGLGRASADALVAEGARVVVAGRTQESLDAAVADLEATRPGQASGGLARLAELRARQGRTEEASALYERAGPSGVVRSSCSTSRSAAASTSTSS